MKKLILKLCFSALLLISLQSLQAVPRFVTEFKECPNDCGWVIRCNYGSGCCHPGSQYFCDELC